MGCRLKSLPTAGQHRPRLASSMEHSRGQGQRGRGLANRGQQVGPAAWAHHQPVRDVPLRTNTALHTASVR